MILTFSKSARELTATTLGEEIAACLNSIVPAIDHPDQNDHLDVDGLRVVGSKLKSAMRSLWQEQTSDVFDIG